MDSKFTNREISNTEEVNLLKMSYLTRILNLVKGNKEVSAFLGLIVIIILGIIIFLKLITISVLSSEEIREKLIGKNLNVNGKEVSITDSNLGEVTIINRSTQKYSTDIVDIEFSINMDNSKVIEEGTMKFNYINNNWVYCSGDIGNLKSIETGLNTEDFIKETIQKTGINTNEGNEYYGSSIKQVTNIECKDYDVDEGGTFTADIVLSNSAYYQSCKVNGKILFNSEEKTWEITSVDMDTNDVIIKEGEVDESILKNIVLDEVTDGSLYEVKSGNSNEFVNLLKDSIKELSLRDYIIREDGTVRVEIDGKATSDIDGEIGFSGVVSLFGKPSYGIVRNSKDIKIYSESNEGLKAENKTEY